MAHTAAAVAGLVLHSSRGSDVSEWTHHDLLFPLAATAFAVGNVRHRDGLTGTDAPAVQGPDINETAALIALAGFLLARRPDVYEPLPMRGWLTFLAAGKIGVLCLLMLFVGRTVGRVAIVAILAGTATLFATVFTYLLLLLLEDVERITPRVLVGAVLVVAGAWLITLF